MPSLSTNQRSVILPFIDNSSNYIIITIITIINKEQAAVLRFSRPSLSWALTVVKIGRKLPSAGSLEEISWNI